MTKFLLFFMVIHLLFLIFLKVKILSFVILVEICYIFYIFNFITVFSNNFGEFITFLMIVVCETSISLSLVVYFFKFMKNQNVNSNNFFNF